MIRQFLWVVMPVLVLVACSGPSSGADRGLGVGERGVLMWDAGGDYVPVFPTRFDLDAAVKARNANDEVGIQEAIGRSLPVRQGARVLVIGRGYGWREIRILSTVHARRRGYVLKEWIRRE